jgi:8-oxo-dGTP diphosphatase
MTSAQRHPSGQDIKVATDAVIFTEKNGALHVLLIQMKKAPHTGAWALPGGLLEQEETSRTAAERILRDQTGVKDSYLDQLATFDEPGRDALGRVVSIAYYALVPMESVTLRTTEKYQDVRWWPVAKLPKLAYDHETVLRAAVDRVRAKLEYTNVVWSLLPPTFTLSRLQGTYEAVLGKTLDKRNFTRKVLDLKMLEETGKRETGAAHRPGALYRFKRRELTFFQIL